MSSVVTYVPLVREDFDGPPLSADTYKCTVLCGGCEKPRSECKCRERRGQ